MITQIKQLSDLRKFYLAYQFFTKATNIFLIAMTISLIFTFFGEKGVIIKDYVVPALSLFIFTPFISGYIIDNPRKAFSWVIAIEVFALVNYCLAEWGYYSQITLLIGLLTLTICNVFVNPLRVKNTSQVVNNDKDYSILSDRINAIFTVTLAAIGVTLVTYDMTTMINIVMTIVCVLLSRFTYMRVLVELDMQKVEDK
jgi:hypothetical protein